MQRGVRHFNVLTMSQCADVKSYVHKIVEFDEIAQADELSFCVRLLWNTHYETILLRHELQLMAIFNTSKQSHASLHPGKAGSWKQPLRVGGRQFSSITSSFSNRCGCSASTRIRIRCVFKEDGKAYFRETWRAIFIFRETWNRYFIFRESWFK